jgi:hypothetical protein
MRPASSRSPPPSRRRSASTSSSTDAPRRDWGARVRETLVDFPTLNARSKFWGDDQRAAFDGRTPARNRSTSASINERTQMRELLRRDEMKVMQENHLDVLVRLHNPLPPGKIGLAPQPNEETRNESGYGPNAGLTEVLIPAGYVQTVYDPSFALNAEKTRYVSVNNTTTPTTVPAPGLQWSLVFRAAPGKEDVILKAASAHQAASKRVRRRRSARSTRTRRARASSGVATTTSNPVRWRPPGAGAPAFMSGEVIVSGAPVGVVAALSVLARPAPSASTQVPSWRFSWRSDDRRRAPRHQEGQITCQELVQAYQPRPRLRRREQDRHRGDGAAVPAGL